MSVPIWINGLAYLPAVEHEAIAAELLETQKKRSVCIDERDKAEDRIRSLEADIGLLQSHYAHEVIQKRAVAAELAGANGLIEELKDTDGVCADLAREVEQSNRMFDRIRALEARIAIWERCWDNIKLHQPGLREDNKPLAVAASYESLRLKLEHTVDEYDEKLAAELALRQTAEAYAARNALRVIEVDADNEWLREGLRGIAKMDIKTEADRMVLWAKDTLSGRATDLPQTETACTCDSTLVTDTSNHQPHCPRYVAETKP